MNCSNNEVFRKEYPESFEMMFMSKSGTALVDTNAGAILELERLCDAGAAPTERELRPITQQDLFKNSQKLFCEKFEFYAYDSCLTGGGTGQDAATVANIEASRTSTDIIPQSYYKHGLLTHNWQPNFFRPRILIDNVNVIKGLGGASSSTAVIDRAFGMPLPHCFEINKELTLSSNLSLFAKYSQFISGTSKYQNYPVIAIGTFWIGSGRVT